MQWKNSGYNPTEVQQDVYADVNTSYSDSRYGQDNQEFSLASIQERLGILNNLEDVDTNNSSADVMPSQQTLNMNYTREYSEENVRAKSKLTTKSKVAIASYAIVVLALVIAVALCSVSVSGAFTSVAALNSAYSEVTDQLAQLNEQIASEDYPALMERAAELGYIDASRSNTMEYTGLETRPAQNFTVESNWFDSLCDWLSNVFGG